MRVDSAVSAAAPSTSPIVSDDEDETRARAAWQSKTARWLLAVLGAVVEQGVLRYAVKRRPIPPAPLSRTIGSRAHGVTLPEVRARRTHWS